MIKAAAGALIGLASMVILFLADPAWDCNLEVEAPRIIEQTPRSFKSEGGAILTTGSLLTSHYIGRHHARVRATRDEV